MSHHGCDSSGVNRPVPVRWDAPPALVDPRPRPRARCRRRRRRDQQPAEGVPSAASVLVSPAGTDANASGGRTKGDINLDTEAQLVKSTAVAVGAKQLLRSPAAPDELAKAVTVEVPANTTVLVIAYTGDSPQAAQASAHAFAEAYLRNREASARARLDREAAAL